MGIFLKVALSSNASDYQKKSTGDAEGQSKLKKRSCRRLCLHSSAGGLKSMHQFREAAHVQQYSSSPAISVHWDAVIVVQKL